MKEQKLAELYDSVEQMMTSIDCYDSVGRDVLRKEMHRVSIAMSDIRDEINFDALGSGTNNIETTLTEEVLGLSNHEFSNLMKEISNKKSIRMEDSRTSRSIKISISDIQVTYSRIKGEVCNIEKAQQILDRVINNYNPRVAIVNQYGSEIRRQDEIDRMESKGASHDVNIDALESLGFK